MSAQALQPVSNREMARRLGVDEKAVRKAIASGRFHESLGKDPRGRAVIVDAELAVVEWQRNAGKVPKGADADVRTADRGESAPRSRTDRPAPGVFVPATTLAEAQRLNANERARKLQMENDLQEGRLVEVSVAVRQAFNAERAIREAILNIPARISAELAAESDAMRLHLRLDEALREALAVAARTIREAPEEGAAAVNG